MRSDGAGGLEKGEFRRVAATFRTFHKQFAPLFGRQEAQRHSERYVRGLLVQQTDRRNAENLAEAVAGASARTLQQFLTEAPWPHEAVIEALQRYLGERLPPTFFPDEPVAQGVFTLDSSGVPKKGRHSVGVAPQYCGQVGKVTNCQLGVYLGYSSPQGHALVDCRLYLPREWVADHDRCVAAGVPETVVAQGYQSQAALGLAMLRRAREIGALAARWVVTDAGFGEIPSFRDALDADGWRYVAEIPSTTRVFTDGPRTESVVLRAGASPRPVEILPPAVSVATLAAELPASAWQTLTVGQGALGPRTYQFAAQRVCECRDDCRGRETWLLLRRNVDELDTPATPATSPPRATGAPNHTRTAATPEQSSGLKYAFSNAPAETPLSTLAGVSALRWTVETEFQHHKNEVGLDEYEVRSWRGWHHHMVLCLLATAFLLTLEQDWGEKGARHHPTATHPRLARTPSAPALDSRRSPPLAPQYVPAQRAYHRLARQTPSPLSA